MRIVADQARLTGSAKAIRVWWVKLPAWLWRWSTVLSVVWSDGLYLTAWPVAAALLPALAVSVGLAEGATHWGPEAVWDSYTGRPTPIAFTQMAPLLYLSAAAGTLSAQFGLLIVLGFALGDVLLGSHILPGWGFSHFIARGIPQAVSYVLFWLLAVQPTLAARALAASIPRQLQTLVGTIWFWPKAILTAALQSLIVYAWTMSAPMIVRPIWMWAHLGWPPLTVPYFTSIVDPGLPASVFVFALLRAILTWKARDNPEVAGRAWELAAEFSTSMRQPSCIRPLPSWMTAGLLALLMTLLLAGFISTVGLGVGMWVLIATILIGRATVLPRLMPWRIWTSLSARVPLLIRWLGLIAGCYFIARLVYLSPGASVRANQAAGAFAPELASIVVGLLLATILLPADASRGSKLSMGRLGAGPRRTSATTGTIAVLLIAAPFASKTAYAYCADSLCCFVNNLQAVLAIAAILLVLASLMFGGLALLAVLADAMAELGAGALFDLFPEVIEGLGADTEAALVEADAEAEAGIKDLFADGNTPSASEIEQWATENGWTRSQAANGPIKFEDGGGTLRVTIKRGSPRAPGSGFPHIELKGPTGQRTDPFGNPVTRTSPGNHTPIKWDL